MTRPERLNRGIAWAALRIALALWTVIGFVLIPSAVLAAGEPDGIAGRVVDGAGRGLAARVWVVGGSWEEPEAVAETQADGEGAFAFPGFWADTKTKKAHARLSHSYSLFARDRDGRVGWESSVNLRNPTPPKILLVEKGEARGRLVDAESRPIAEAEVVPTAFTRSHAGRSRADYIRLSPKLARPYAARTGADGSFTLKDVPKGAEVQARITAPGFGAPRASWDSNKAVTIALDGRLGRIEGRVAPADGKPLKGAVLMHLRHSNPPGDHPGGDFQLIYLKTVKVGGDGTFRFDDLPPGRYAMNAAFDPDSSYQADPLPDVEVGPGAKVAGVSVPLKRLLALRGRVVDEVSGEGLAGVGLHASHVSGNSRQYAGQAETDAQGRYRINVPPGMTVVQPESTPKRYLAIRYEDCPRFDVTADRDWPDLKLQHAAALDGVVVDADGKPVDGAEVHLVMPDPSGFTMNNPSIRTGADGTFRLERLDPDDTLPVRARTKSATTDGAVVIRPKDQKGPLTLTVDPKRSAHVRGAVKDGAGKPVAGAKVMLSWGRNYVSEKTRYSGIGSVMGSYTTDDAGRFRSSALWPGDRYKVAVAAEGYGVAESAEITGRAGDDHDFGTITLVGASGHVAGKVVDSAGKAVEGVTVFNHGDAPEPVTTRTGGDGTFRLGGLFVGGKYVFARKAGYRFAGVRVEGEADDLTVTLLRGDEPPSKWMPGTTATPDEQRALAKTLLIRLWDRYGKEANKNGSFVCILQMARIDPALALTWSAQAGGRYNGRVSQERGEELAETDADGALELLTAPGVGPSWYILERLAERFAGEDRARALRFAEEAAVQARALDQPDRAGAMAKAGAVLAKLGRKEAGLKLIEEAAGAAARMGTERRQAYARGNVAGALAPFDLKRALALVEPIKAANDRDRYTGFIASAIAATDPQRALALADTIGGNSSAPQSVKLGIAYAIGADRPDEAVRIIDGMKGYAAEKYQTEALGWLAVAVAPKDPKRAEALIDRALTVPVERSELFQSWTYFGGGSGTAAWVAACARRAGYPDMAGAVARVLASRPAGPYRDPSMETQSQTIAAAALALTDPGAARQILRDLETRSGLSPAELGRVARDRWLMAWALADPKHAEELFEAELAALKGEKDVDLQRTGLLKMTEVLAVPPRRREVFLRRQIGATWHPDMPD